MRAVAPLEAQGILYDVMIVGAGPAGASAAYFLGGAGKRVLVLEKARLPRYKTCGGGLSACFLAQEFPFSFEPVLQTQVDAIAYAFNGTLVRIPLRQGCLSMVMRDQLDLFILQHASADVCQGAAVKTVLESTDRVQVELQDGATFSARYLIGADGANSVVARVLGLRRSKRLAAALRPKPGLLQETLVRVMARYGIQVDLSGKTFAHGHPIPIYLHREQIATARTLLAGDAAGLADPLSGEGIRFAIKSGHIAAAALLSGHPERYARDIFWKIGVDHYFSVPAAYIFYTLEKLCLWLGAPNPFTTVAIIDMLADRLSTVQIVLHGFCTLPLFAMTELVAHIAQYFKGPSAANRVRARVYPRSINFSV